MHRAHEYVLPEILWRNRTQVTRKEEKWKERSPPFIRKKKGIWKWRNDEINKLKKRTDPNQTQLNLFAVGKEKKNPELL
jgi:hypothetical protein